MIHTVSLKLTQKNPDQILSYNYQKLYFKNKISCVGNGFLICFDDGGKLQILYVRR